MWDCSGFLQIRSHLSSHIKDILKIVAWYFTALPPLGKALIHGLLNQACASQSTSGFLKLLLFVMPVCVSTPKAINYIHVIFNLYNQLNKFVMFRNITKQFFVCARPL